MAAPWTEPTAPESTQRAQLDPGGPKRWRGDACLSRAAVRRRQAGRVAAVAGGAGGAGVAGVAGVAGRPGGVGQGVVRSKTVVPATVVAVKFSWTQAAIRAASSLPPVLRPPKPPIPAPRK